MKTYRPYSPRQSYLFPPSPQEWLADDHLAYFILDVVAQLDLSEILAPYEREERGFPPHHPQMMLGLLLYGYCTGVSSSRKLEKATWEDVATRVVSGGTHPDHCCIAEFRARHRKAFKKLFLQVLKLCEKAGLVKLGHVALDGTKMKANASKHKAMSYERMKRQEKDLTRRVEELLRQAEARDALDDQKYGKGKRGDELPEDLRHAETRLARIGAAKAELEAEAKALAEAERDHNDDDEPPPGGPTPLPEHRVPHGEDGTPGPKAQRNFTDPDSRIQKTGDGYVQGYNCQAAVDDAHQIIVAEAVTNQPPDAEHLAPMLEQVVENCGAPEKVTADTGYFSKANVAAAEALGIGPYIATDRWKRGEPRPKAPRGRPPAGLTPKQRMKRKLLTKAGLATYSRRKTTVEPVFGQVKQARGLRQFLLRGIEKVRAEWSLICLTHNL
ncbi:MAG TPA: IS1182 family transposase, partial [Myxococcaceae bacterium]|nr:IS1182 family transposase [Myxococcaceae bacterium]